MRKYRNLTLSVASGLLLWLSWPVSPTTFFIFFGFVPLLLLEYTIKSRLSFFGWCYLTLLIWNVGSTWWICNSTVPGGVAAIVMNTLLMCVPWMAFFVVKKRKGRTVGYVSLLLFWMTFEYIHLNWELSWPWLTLGNVFASRPGWIQWYEFTGSSGGTLWVMLLNILITTYIIRYTSATVRRHDFKLAGSIFMFLALPLLISTLILKSREQQFNTGNRGGKNIVVVQPNIDPYMKFESGMQEGQVQTMIQLSESQIDSSTALLVWPETALNLPSGINLDKIKEYPQLQPVYQLLEKYPEITLLTGIEGMRFFPVSNKTESSQVMPGAANYVESYNAAMMLHASGDIQLYYKSKLVPGVETLPSFLRILASWFEQFGGTGGGYKAQDERTVMKDPAHGYLVAPAICYESIFGEFLTGYTRNTANVICIITNDGWWANTSGHKQHLQYARLRAIENRRWIARSANTGISAFISPVGLIFQPKPWDTPAAIRMDIPSLNGETFFVTHGDIISRLCIILTSLLLLWWLVLWVKQKLSKGKQYAEKM